MPKKKNKMMGRMFDKIHMGNIVYNTCWEDPRCDRSLMNFNSSSRIVMITSAGCNALDYLLDKPAEIHCVDMNRRQNALLHLKKAAIASGDADPVFEMFGKGRHKHAREFYEDELRNRLPEFAANYWDKKIKIFHGKGFRKTFYYRGTAGTFAWMLMTALKAKPGLLKSIRKLIEASTLEQQREHFAKVEKKLFGTILKWIMNRNLTLSMLGIHEGQQQFVLDKAQGGIMQYIRDCMKHVFTELPVQDNYFWRVYVKGQYNRECCPNYLKPENIPALQTGLDSMKTYNTTISEFLKENPGRYSHYVLLDHQDWLSKHDHAALDEEWKLILQNSEPGTKVLLRSASKELNFIPAFAKERMDFSSQAPAAEARKDRVGTYRGVTMGVVK